MKYVFYIILSFAWDSCYAQLPPIDTDRPDQTESVNTIPVRWLQFEAGFGFQKNDDKEREYLLPSILTKYGITKNIELRLITTLQSLKTSSERAEPGISPVQIGTKIRLWKEHKYLPQASLIYQAELPFLSSQNKKVKNAAHEVVGLLQHSLTSKTALGANMGVAWQTGQATFFYTLSPGVTFSEKWYGYIEVFGSFSKQQIPQHNIDGGIAFYLNPNTKIDVSSGFGIAGEAPLYYIALGFSVRFKP
ncbi:hypothetical protein BH09BAC2_BH09BAC2_15400 [soil metagenome]